VADCRAVLQLTVEQGDGMRRCADSVAVVEEGEVENQQAAPVCPNLTAIRWELRTQFLEGGQVVVVAPQSEAELADVGGGVVEEAEAG
jgi:hypothetical protein